jgi:hypothetical protein
MLNTGNSISKTFTKLKPDYGVRIGICCCMDHGQGAEGGVHGLINYKDTNAKYRHLKNLPVKGLCGRCLSEFIDWIYSHLGFFDPAL